MHVKCYRTDGSVRAIWAKPFARVFREHNTLPVRGSNVIAISEGRYRGWFHVDFSSLADLTGDESFRVCLRVPYESHEEAVAAEHVWLISNWVCEQ